MLEIRKRIALFTCQPECAYPSQFLEGFLSEAARLNYDVVVFTTFLKTGCSEGFQHGEVNIYNLANLDIFDAVVLMPDTLAIPGVFESLCDRVHKTYNKPVIMVDIENDWCTSVFVQDGDAIELIVDHVIEKHGCKDIVFVSGKRNHLHSQLREEGYKMSLIKHGLPVDEDKIYYGEFWYDKGEEIVAAIVEKGTMPDAICCASDTMAISIVEALGKYNIKVPSQVIVTGYDSDGDGIRNYHSVTSLPRRNTALGFDAMRMVHAKINGTEYVPEKQTYSSLDIVTASCGCRHFRQQLEQADTRHLYHTAYDLEGFDSGYNFMIEDAISSDNIVDCMWKLSYYTLYLGDFEKYSLCLCSDWLDIAGNIGLPQRTDGYTDEMVLALVQRGEQGDVNMERRFRTKDILPDIVEPAEHPSVYFVTPTHFNEFVIGYSVLSMGQSVEPYGIDYSRWSRYVNVALESVHRHLVNEHMYEMMEQQAMLDALTGLYNRNGLYKLAPKVITRSVEENQRLLVITGDLNCMKYINDNFGHSEGDETLKFVAKAILEATKADGGYAFRTGGDEFLYLNTGEYSIDQISKILNDIRDRFKFLVEDAGKPYPASIALGYSCASVKAFDSMDRLLSPADDMMFRDKQEIKKQLGDAYFRK